MFNVRTVTIISIAVSAALIARSPAAANDKTEIVDTEAGLLQGVVSGNINRFLGIAYAAPPIGALRWRPPQPRRAWKGVLEATTPGSPCSQLDSSYTASGQEDCLFLNVYAPRTQTRQGLPVMVWIHGGCGCGENPKLSFKPPLPLTDGAYFDPTPLVEQGLVVVTLNYRLGVLGRFAHPALDGKARRNANYGLLDQQFALKWVKKNIKAFGGNPKQVTIFGESAGGISVYANLASPTAKGLFHAAIAQSAALLFHKDLPSSFALEQAEATGIKLATSVGCPLGRNTAKCLRGLSAPALVQAQAQVDVDQFLYPIVDGTVLTESLYQAFEKGRYTKVPVMSGSNHDEWRTQVALTTSLADPPNLLTNENYADAVAAFFKGTLSPDQLSGILSLYPPTPSAPLALGALGTDFAFACPARKAAQWLSQHAPNKTYAYEFNDQTAPSTVPASPGFPLGAAHFSEVQYLFNIDGKPTNFATKVQENLSKTMISYWTQFAKTGDPNVNPNVPDAWHPYNAAADKFQSLELPKPVETLTFAGEHYCWLWSP